MPVRFFVDENDLALGKALADQRDDVVYPGHPNIPGVARGCLDDLWRPAIGSMALIVITRDRRIRYRPVEQRMWLDHRVRGFVLTGRKSQSTADSLAVLGRRWGEIETLAAARPVGPWMFALTSGSIREILI